MPIQAGKVADSIGALTSQHLANLYLGVLDHYVKDDLGVQDTCDMDGFAVFGTKEEVLQLRRQNCAVSVRSVGLSLNERPSRAYCLCAMACRCSECGVSAMIRISRSRWQRFQKKASRCGTAAQRRNHHRGANRRQLDQSVRAPAKVEYHRFGGDFGTEYRRRRREARWEDRNKDANRVIRGGAWNNTRRTRALRSATTNAHESQQQPRLSHL